MELIAPLPSKANKKAEERKKFATARQQQQVQQQQLQQRRFSQGSNNSGSSSNNNGNGNNNSAPMPRRKIGVFGNPKFSPIVEEQNPRAEGLNPNSASFQTQQQQRKNSRSNQNIAQGSGAGNGTDAAGISAWMTRRISGGQLEYTRSGTTKVYPVELQTEGFTIS